MKHTHVLAQPHSMVVDGRRMEFPAGTEVTPSEASLKNLPDVFLPIGSGKAPEAPKPEPVEEHDEDVITESKLAEMTVGEVRDLVAGVEDEEWLEALQEMEKAGKGRKGALAAIAEALESLAG